MNQGNRYYLDYNATSPVAASVRELIASEGLSFGNPSSVHATGKRARRAVNEVTSFLYTTFDLSESHYQLIYHSGATEGINSIVKGMALNAFENKKTFSFFAFESDHSCVCNQKGFLESLGFRYHVLPVTKEGAFDEKLLKEAIKADDAQVKLLNWTWINNETGVVNSLEMLSSLKQELKEELAFFVHVDGVQAPGKVSNWHQLNDSVDAYTFSGHKFGALKGSGFSFLKEGLPLNALLNGGGQQLGLRSGTENTWGIFSLKCALEYLKENYDFNVQNEATRFIEENMNALVGDRGEVIASENPSRNGNTIYLLLYGIKAHTSAMVFDMAGIDLSNGSACSSGAVIPSRVLLSMGYDEEQAKSALRLSFGPYFNKKEATHLWPLLENVFKRLLS